MSLKRTRPTVVSKSSSPDGDRAVLCLDAPSQEPRLYARVEAELAGLVRGYQLLGAVEDLALALLAVYRGGQEVAPEHHVLAGRDDGRAVRGAEDVLRRHHQHPHLYLRLYRERQVDGHLVAVEVGVEALAHERMQLDRVALHEHRLEGLDAHPVERRSAVEHDGMVLDDLLEDVPDLLFLVLEHLLGGLDRVRVAKLLQAPDDERLVELERDLLGQAALVELELRAHDDDAPRAVVDALAQQVLAEAPLLALDHVGERLQGAVGRAEHGPLAAAVVEERVDGLLEHALLVADDDLGSVELDEPLQPVVAVDDSAVEVVKVAGREVSAVEEDQRPQVRRYDGDDLEDHPVRAVLAAEDVLDDLEALDELLGLLLGLGLSQVLAELDAERLEVELPDEVADGLRAHADLEGLVAVLLEREAVLLVGEELLVLQRRIPGIEDDIVLEVDHALHRGRLHVEEVAEAVGHSLEEPDMHDRRGQRDVAHPLAPDARVRDLHAAAVADDALVLDALVLAAGALPVALRAEYPLAEEPVLLRTVGAVVDRLGLLDLPVAPGTDDLRARQTDLDRRVLVDSLVRSVHYKPPPWA